MNVIIIFDIINNNIVIMSSIAYKSFNAMLSEFIENLSDVFDDVSELQTANKALTGMLEINDEVEIPLETFHEMFGEHSDLIMNKDVSLFENVSLPMVDGFDMKKAYAESDEDTRGSIWEYLKQLSILATTIKTLTPEMFSNISSVTESFMSKVQSGEISEEQAKNPLFIMQAIQDNPDLMKAIGN